MAHFGKVTEFIAGKEIWSQYVERLEHLFAANGITDKAKMQSILLSSIGPDAYKLLWNLVSPAKPGEKSYKELVAIMAKHQHPTPSEIVQRCKFNSRQRKQGESIATYVAELRAIAEFCNYGDKLDEMLRDRLVCGVNDDRIQCSLLKRSELTLEKALEIAISSETASHNATDLKKASQQSSPSTSANVEGVVKSIPKGKRTRKSTAKSTTCYRCGGRNHDSKDCWFKDSICRSCGKKGHIEKVCRSKKIKQVIKPVTDAHRSETRQSENEDYDLFMLQTRKGGPLTVEVNINKIPTVMEVDTGASLSIMTETEFRKSWPKVTVRQSEVPLKTYTGEPLAIVGMATVNVQYKNQRNKVKLCIVKGNGPSLFGRDWLTKFRLDWPSLINNINNRPLEAILAAHSEVFRDQLGTLKGTSAKINVDPTVQPIYCKARSVPYAMKEKVNTELDRLQAEGIIEPVQYADWAAPIVPILKSDKVSVRICGDYKLTVNKASRVDNYPIPKLLTFSQPWQGEKCSLSSI